MGAETNGTGPPIRVDHDGRIATVTIDRPHRRNALRADDFVELARIFGELNHPDADVRVVILTGAGGHFCAGSDLADMSGVATGPRATMALMWSLQNAARALHQVRVPVLAAVTGYAIGAGSSFALGADLTYAADTAKFGQLFVDRAMSLDLGASSVLVRRVGLSTAKELAFTAAMVEAAEARRIGLVDGLFPEVELLNAVLTKARVIAEKPPLAVAMIKNQLNRAVTSTFDEALDYESVTASLAASSEDTAEAMLAFTQKRSPTFTGH